MCGIAGIVNLQAGPPDRGVVQGMMDVMRHRGPDGEGIYSDPQVALGHVRLSIIDVEGSKQPLANEDETVWVIFNGEIYNYRDLRDELAAKGHRLRTQGDTETLVHLYEDYGPEMVHRLVGMFAFAIWDKKNRQLFLARDRLGIKPLYYSRQGDDFVFASEIKAFLLHPQITARPSTEGVWNYLTYRSVPSPATLLEGIIKVRPGHCLTFSEKGMQLVGLLGYPPHAARGDPHRRPQSRTNAAGGGVPPDDLGETAADQRCSARGVPERGGRFQPDRGTDERPDQCPGAHVFRGLPRFSRLRTGLCRPGGPAVPHGSSRVGAGGGLLRGASREADVDSGQPPE